MAHSTNAGILFFGGAYQAERPFMLSVLKAARENGYKRFVEPCSGTLAGCCMAKSAGFEIAEASDVILFPSLVGSYMAGGKVEDFGLTINGEAATTVEGAIYEVERAMLSKNSWNENGQAQFRDFEQREEQILDDLKDQLAELKKSIPGNFAYTAEDMFVHLEKVKDDPTAIVWLWPPTYKNNYEKLYEDVDKIATWKNQPTYEVFDPADGYDRVIEMMADAKCLLIMGEESSRAHGTAIYGRHSGRVGVNTYIVSNRPEEVESWVGKQIFRPNPSEEQGGLFELFNEDVTEDSVIEVVRLTPAQMRHYKKVLIKRFQQSNTTDGFAMLIDGKLAGVFGYMDVGINLGGSKYAMQSFALTVPGHRLARLNTIVAAQREQLERHYDDPTMATLEGVQSLTITDKPMSMELRGIAELVESRKDGRGRNVLVYRMPIGEMTLEEVKREFLRKPKPARQRRGRGRARGRNRPSEG